MALLGHRGRDFPGVEAQLAQIAAQGLREADEVKAGGPWVRLRAVEEGMPGLVQHSRVSVLGRVQKAALEALASGPFGDRRGPYFPVAMTTNRASIAPAVVARRQTPSERWMRLTSVFARIRSPCRSV